MSRPIYYYETEQTLTSYKNWKWILEELLWKELWAGKKCVSVDEQRKEKKRTPIICSNDIRAQLEILYGWRYFFAFQFRTACECVRCACELSRYFLLRVYLLLFIGIDCVPLNRMAFSNEKFKWFFWWQAPLIDSYIHISTEAHSHAHAYQ